MEHFDSAKIMKREQQIHLHSQRRSKRRERIAAKKIDITKGDFVDTMQHPKTDHEREILRQTILASSASVRLQSKLTHHTTRLHHRKLEVWDDTWTYGKREAMRHILSEEGLYLLRVILSNF